MPHLRNIYTTVLKSKSFTLSYMYKNKNNNLIYIYIYIQFLPNSQEMNYKPFYNLFKGEGKRKTFHLY